MKKELEDEAVRKSDECNISREEAFKKETWFRIIVLGGLIPAAIVVINLCMLEYSEGIVVYKHFLPSYEWSVVLLLGSIILFLIGSYGCMKYHIIVAGYNIKDRRNKKSCEKE